MYRVLWALSCGPKQYRWAGPYHAIPSISRAGNFKRWMHSKKNGYGRHHRWSWSEELISILRLFKCFHAFQSELWHHYFIISVQKYLPCMTSIFSCQSARACVLSQTNALEWAFLDLLGVQTASISFGIQSQGWVPAQCSSITSGQGRKADGGLLLDSRSQQAHQIRYCWASWSQKRQVHLSIWHDHSRHSVQAAVSWQDFYSICQWRFRGALAAYGPLSDM